MGLPGLLTQDIDEIDQLLVGSVLGASEFHKKHLVSRKGLKKDFPSLLAPALGGHWPVSPPDGVDSPRQ